MIRNDGYEILDETSNFAAPVRQPGPALKNPLENSKNNVERFQHIYIQDFVGGEILASPSNRGEFAMSKPPNQELECSKYFYTSQEQGHFL